MQIADPLRGKNGPRPKRTRGRSRNTLMNIVSKQAPPSGSGSPLQQPTAKPVALDRLKANISTPPTPGAVSQSGYVPGQAQSAQLTMPGALSSLVSSMTGLSAAKSPVPSGVSPQGSGGGANIQVNGTPDQRKFATLVLKKIGAPPSDNNMALMLAWMQGEGTDAAWNPLATTQPAPGSTQFNSANVQNYRSIQQGVQATAKTLLNGNYGPIIKLLHASANPLDTARAIADSPWGTGQLVLQVLRNARK